MNRHRYHGLTLSRSASVFNLLICAGFCFVFRKDSFAVSCGTYLGRLTKIRIGHDNTGFGAAWFLDKVSQLDLT